MWVEITRQAWSSVVTFGTECSKREFTELYVRYYYEANGCHLVAMCMLTTIEQRYYDKIINPAVCFDNYNVQQYPTLKSIIEAEKHGYTVRLIEDWLRGLPSACTIPFWDNEITALGYDPEFYWNSAARVLYKVAEDITPLTVLTTLSNYH